ncbi:hypothetical protein [Corynebacterium efficiens YS-314]|uniref:Uncharacterized protein n=2 Tax=Corynebacterium efficiens TaxID=152794 RepID=Q8FTX7_COREF|nr:hypothetical protein [Corynebacterium efficiens YS-314]
MTETPDRGTGPELLRKTDHEQGTQCGQSTLGSFRMAPIPYSHYQRPLSGGRARFTFTEALDVIQAVQLEYRARMETHWEEIRQAGFSNEKEKALSEAGMRRMVEYTQTMALPPSVDEATFDVESLLTHIDLEEDIVRLVLDECSFDYGQRTPADVKQLLLSLDPPMVLR